jgi:hypothetical protein
MTVKELVEFAKVNGIEVKKSGKKAEIINAIESSGWAERKVAELMPNTYDHRLYHNETGVQVLGEEDLVEADNPKEEEVMELTRLEDDILDALSWNKNPTCRMCQGHDPRCSYCGASGIEPLLTLPQKNFMRDIWKACKAEDTVSQYVLDMVATDIKEDRMQKGVCVGLIEMMGLSLPEDHPIYISVCTNMVKREMEYWIKMLDKKQNGPDARRLAQHMRRHKAIRFDVGGDAKWIEVAREMSARASSLMNNSINNRF